MLRLRGKLSLVYVPKKLAPIRSAVHFGQSGSNYVQSYSRIEYDIRASSYFGLFYDVVALQ